MPKKYFSKKPRKGGRRLGGPGSGRKPRAGLPLATLAQMAPRAVNVARRVNARLRGAKYRSPYSKRTMRSEGLSSSDNITQLPITTIGTPRKLSFAEKVARVERPPILFKRNYQFSAEGYAGRKAWFNINFNHHSNDLNQDITTYKENLTTDTAMPDDTFTSNAVSDRARFYVDYMSSKLQFMNSSTNALTGKMHLFAVRRDAKATYNNVPINPVNLMAYYSTFAVPQAITAQESGTSNGWKFVSTAGPLSNSYITNVNMPGSSLNTTGVCLSTDLALSPMSSHIKSDVAFWFKHVSTQSFNLKPGQQVNKIFKFHDLPIIAREQLDFEYLDGVSYQLAVEFQGQIVGSDDLVAGLNLITTGSCQLSVIREDIRILGQKNGLKPKVMLITSPLSSVPASNQYIINPDSGVPLGQYEQTGL